MIKCDTDCIPLCDFCRNWEPDKQPKTTGVCNLHEVRTVIHGKCEDFHCYKAKEDN